MASRAVAVETASRFVGTDVFVLESARGMRDVVEEIQAFARALVFEKPCPAPVGYQNPCVIHHLEYLFGYLKMLSRVFLHSTG